MPLSHSSIPRARRNSSLVNDGVSSHACKKTLGKIEQIARRATKFQPNADPTEYLAVAGLGWPWKVWA